MIIGHEEIKNRLVHLVQTGRVPQSLIFTGPNAVGKSLVAKALADTLLCEEPGNLSGLKSCGECTSCQLLKANTHPDFFSLDCDTSGVEEARELLSKMTLSPFRGKAKVALIFNAHALNAQTANTLLKTLEEPRAGTFFILVTHNPGKLLPTIRSRCQILRFSQLAQDDIGQVLRLLGFNPDDHVSLAKSFGGTLDFIPLLENPPEILSGLDVTLAQIAHGDLDCALSLAMRLQQEKDAIPHALTVMRAYAKRKLEESEGPAAARETFAVFLEDLISAERLVFERNLSPQLVFATLLTRLAGEMTDPGEIMKRTTLRQVTL